MKVLLSTLGEPVAIVIIVAVLICSVYFIIRFFKLQNPEKVKMTGDTVTDIENGIINTLATFHNMAFQLHLTYVLLGCIAIISSVFVTTFIAGNASDDNFKDYLPYVSFASTASLTLITAFNLGQKQTAAAQPGVISTTPSHGIKQKKLRWQIC